MADFLDEAKEYIQDVPLWAWGLIGAGGAVLLFIGSRKPEPAPVPLQAEPASGNERRKQSSAELATRLNQFKQALSQQLQEREEMYQEKLRQIEEETTERLTATNEIWAERVSALQSNYNERIQSLRNQLEDVGRVARDTSRKVRDIDVRKPKTKPDPKPKEGIWYKGKFMTPEEINAKVRKEKVWTPDFDEITVVDDGKEYSYDEWADLRLKGKVKPLGED